MNIECFVMYCIVINFKNVGVCKLLQN